VETFCHDYGKGPVCQYLVEPGFGSFGPSLDAASRRTIYKGSVTFPKENCTATLSYAPLSRESFLKLTGDDPRTQADRSGKDASTPRPPSSARGEEAGQGASVAVATEVQANSVKASESKGAGAQATKVEVSQSSPGAIQRTRIVPTSASPSSMSPTAVERW
jgi:hypothetical protein